VVAFQDGSALVCMDRIDGPGVAEWVRAERVGHFAAVPTILYDLLTHPGVTREDLASLRKPEVGGAECPEEFRALYRERFGAEVTIGYGMTEAPTAVTRSDGSASPLPGLCGRAVPQVQILIVDEKDQLAPAGEVGEICVAPAVSGRGGVYSPMSH
jgi:fatty-acyl-CoA synthase